MTRAILACAYQYYNTNIKLPSAINNWQSNDSIRKKIKSRKKINYCEVLKLQKVPFEVEIRTDLKK
jgi:hypothetical protein